MEPTDVVAPYAEPVAGPQPKATGPIFVAKEDVRESENIQLRTMVLAEQLKNIELMLSMKAREHQEMVAKIEANRKEIEAKYGINLQTHFIQPDGLVVPRPPAGTLQGLLGQSLAGAR